MGASALALDFNICLFSHSHPALQIICLSRITRYLILKGSLLLRRNSPGKLSFHVSLAIQRHSNRGKFWTGDPQRISLPKYHCLGALLSFCLLERARKKQHLSISYNFISFPSRSSWYHNYFSCLLFSLLNSPVG